MSLIRKESSEKNVNKGKWEGQGEESGHTPPDRAIAEFSKVIDYVENPSCRHGCISEYFDEERPNCPKACDFCTSPLKIKKEAGKLSRLQHQSGANGSSAHEEDGNLYCRGSRKEGGWNEEVDDNEHDESSLAAIRRMKEESEMRLQSTVSLLKARRRNDDSPPPSKRPNLKTLRIPLKHPEDDSVIGVDCEMRQQYCTFLAADFSPQNKAFFMLDTASQKLILKVEYAIYCRSKVAMMYRKAFVTLSNHMRKADSHEARQKALEDFSQTPPYQKIPLSSKALVFSAPSNIVPLTAESSSDAPISSFNVESALPNQFHGNETSLSSAVPEKVSVSNEIASLLVLGAGHVPQSSCRDFMASLNCTEKNKTKPYKSKSIKKIPTSSSTSSEHIFDKKVISKQVCAVLSKNLYGTVIHEKEEFKRVAKLVVDFIIRKKCKKDVLEMTNTLSHRIRQEGTNPTTITQIIEKIIL